MAKAKKKATKKKTAKKSKAKQPAAEPKPAKKSADLVGLEIEPVKGGYQVVMRVKLPGKGGAPRKMVHERVFRHLSRAVRTAEILRSSKHSNCEITIKE
jgi:hypothetical protein